MVHLRGLLTQGRHAHRHRSSARSGRVGADAPKGAHCEPLSRGLRPDQCRGSTDVRPRGRRSAHCRGGHQEADDGFVCFVQGHQGPRDHQVHRVSDCSEPCLQSWGPVIEEEALGSGLLGGHRRCREALVVVSGGPRGCPSSYGDLGALAPSEQALPPHRLHTGAL